MPPVLKTIKVEKTPFYSTITSDVCHIRRFKNIIVVSQQKGKKESLFA
jgi:hypothetical protein